MNTTLKDAIITAGKISDMTDKLAGMLNCKPADVYKAIAILMENEGLEVATVVHAGRTYNATYRKAAADSMVFDSDAAKAMMAAAGMEIPTKVRKGNAATAKVK